MPANGIIEDKLLCAQIIFRHGSRTPLHLLPNIAEVSYSPQLFIPFKKFLDEFEIVKLRGPDTMSQDDYLASSGVDINVTLKGGAPYGVLTNQGQKQLYTLGQMMKKRFEKNTEFWNRIQQPHQIYARSSFLQRTIESMKYFLLGFLNNSDHKIHVDCFTKDCMFPNWLACPLLRIDYSKLYEALPDDNVLKKTKNSFLDDLNISECRYSLLECGDELVCRKALNLFMDEKLDYWLSKMLPLLADEYRYLYETLFDFRIYLKISVGRLLTLFLQNFEKCTSDGCASEPSLYLFAAHDSTIHTLCVALGFYDKIWPPYASYIMFELYSHFDEPYVVITYNNEVKSLNNSGETKIPYSVFKAHLGHFACSDEELEEICERHSM